MAEYRQQLEQKESDLKAQYDNLINEMDENPSIALSRECSDKYLELITVRSRLDNLGTAKIMEIEINVTGITN